MIMEKEIKKIEAFLTDISTANTEKPRKDLLMGLLQELFRESKETLRILTEMSKGAEKPIKFTLGDKEGHGAQDMQYANVIVEFKNDLKKGEKKAKEQLRRYFIGNVNRDANDKNGKTEINKPHNYVLIATDCVQWKIYSPAMNKPIDSETTEDDVELKEGIEFTLDKDNAEDFYHFLDRYLFRTKTTPATLESIRTGFGELSHTFTNSLNDLKIHYEDIKNTGTMKVAHEEWKRFLSISYGEAFHDTPDRFLVHSYLSMLVKLIAYKVLDTKEGPPSNEELLSVLQGDVFKDLKINNFVERDFFYWTATKDNKLAILPVLWRIQGELKYYEFDNVREDILKGIYQELINRDTQEQLGEFYTPDWLCERMIHHLNPKENQKAIDPACGSGSFLRAWVQHLKDQYSDMNAQQLLQSVVGIEIHPLSMQIAKVTLILSLSSLIKNAKTHLQLPIYLANTLYIPESSMDMFEGEYRIRINDEKIALHKDLFEDLGRFGVAIKACDEISAQSLKEEDKMSKEEEKEALLNTIQKAGHKRMSEALIDALYRLYLRLKKAKETKRDSLWRFIIENNLRPAFLKQSKFDYVMGNPPWVVYRTITSEEYQNTIKEIAKEIGVVPNPKNMPNLDLAAVFLAYASYHFLKPKGTIGFVLPRSFLSADQHENMRAGRIESFELQEIWDLNEVKGLFNIPACVLFGTHTEKEKVSYPNALKGRRIQGKIPKGMHDTSWKEIKSTLKWKKRNFICLVWANLRLLAKNISTCQKKAST